MGHESKGCAYTQHQSWALPAADPSSEPLSAAAWALRKGANRERLRGLLKLDVELIPGALDLVEPQPRESGLHPHAGHTADGSGLDDPGYTTAVPKMEPLAGDGDEEVALAGEGNL